MTGDGHSILSQALGPNGVLKPGRVIKDSVMTAASLSRRALLFAAPASVAVAAERIDPAFIARALAMRDKAQADGDQAYGAIVVCGKEIISEMPSRVVVNNDPTAHAEMEAIRAAARILGGDLTGCVLVSSSRPCPMCEAAAHWAGVSRMYFGSEGTDAGAPQLCG